MRNVRLTGVNVIILRDSHGNYCVCSYGAILTFMFATSVIIVISSHTMYQQNVQFYIEYYKFNSTCFVCLNIIVIQIDDRL